MEYDLWKDQVERLNFLISKEITLIPTPTIPDGKIVQISDGEITRILVQIKGFNKVNKLISKGNRLNSKRPFKTSSKQLIVAFLK